MHNSLLGTKHKVMSIDAYETSPRRYMRVTCQHHDGEVAVACGNCNKLLCGECDIQNEQCTG